jgi:ribulose kinase
MNGNLLDGLNPVTQTIESGKALAKFLGMKEELPETIVLANGARLTLSSKKDCYYFTNAKVCTCKAGTYGRICRHRKSMESSKLTMAEVLEEHDRNLHKMPASYQRMVRMAREEAESEPLELIHKGGFKPCLPEEA